MSYEIGLRKYSEQAMPEIIIEAHRACPELASGIMIENECHSSSIATKFKQMKIIKAKGPHAERYGKPGTECREQFREEAFTYYFGEIIRTRRKELKMSQEQLADAVGKKRPYISRIENGEDVRLSNLLLVADALDLSVELKAKPG